MAKQKPRLEIVRKLLDYLLEILGLVSAKIQLFSGIQKPIVKSSPSSLKVSKQPLQLIKDLSQFIIETIYQCEGKYV